MNLCNRCKHGIFSRWGSNTRYDYYVSCPYSTHNHYARKKCTFYNKGSIPVCPQHKCEMMPQEIYENVTIYHCNTCNREVWVHKNGLKREVEPELDLESREGKWMIKNSFDIIESTRVDNWE